MSEFVTVETGPGEAEVRFAGSDVVAGRCVRQPDGKWEPLNRDGSPIVPWRWTYRDLHAAALAIKVRL